MKKNQEIRETWGFAVDFEYVEISFLKKRKEHFFFKSHRSFPLVGARRQTVGGFQRRQLGGGRRRFRFLGFGLAVQRRGHGGRGRRPRPPFPPPRPGARRPGAPPQRRRFRRRVLGVVLVAAQRHALRLFVPGSRLARHLRLETKNKRKCSINNVHRVKENNGNGHTFASGQVH